jgi:hypothetical protein
LSAYPASQCVSKNSRRFRSHKCINNVHGLFPQRGRPLANAHASALAVRPVVCLHFALASAALRPSLAYPARHRDRARQGWRGACHRSGAGVFCVLASFRPRLSNLLLDYTPWRRRQLSAARLLYRASIFASHRHDRRSDGLGRFAGRCVQAARENLPRDSIARFGTGLQMRVTATPAGRG